MIRTPSRVVPRISAPAPFPAASAARLWVQINQEDTLPLAGQSIGQVQGERGFSNSSFLLDDCYCLGHDPPPSILIKCSPQSH